MYLTVFTSQQVSTSPLGAHSIKSPGCPVATDQSLSGFLSGGSIRPPWLWLAPLGFGLPPLGICFESESIQVF